MLPPGTDARGLSTRDGATPWAERPFSASKISEQIGLSGRQTSRMDQVLDTEWMAQGNCADKPPSLFFPSDGVGVEVAKRVCADCPMKATCLEYALSNRIDHGVWGGTSERERRRILKARAARRPVAVG